MASLKDLSSRFRRWGLSLLTLVVGIVCGGMILCLLENTHARKCTQSAAVTASREFLESNRSNKVDGQILDLLRNLTEDVEHKSWLGLDCTPSGVSCVTWMVIVCDMAFTVGELQIYWFNLGSYVI